MSIRHATLLIVGAGPSGLVTAIALVKHGFRDFIIVEETEVKSNASRAMAIHAATLEALDSIGCAEPLITLGIKGEGLQLSDRANPFFQTDFTSLTPYTRFPYVLLIPQNITERVFEALLNQLDVQVLRPEKAIGLKSVDGDHLEVTFESGTIIKTQYVVGADGARSVIRQLAGIGFTDPDGDPIDERLAQMILADVSFSSDSPYLPVDQAFAVTQSDKFFLIIPLPRGPQSSGSAVYRIGFNVPLPAGPPPSNPLTSYLQQYLNQQGPTNLSSDPSVNSDPIYISKTIWSTRFRTHAAIADKFMTRLDSTTNPRGIVLLVGDAAHIHSPAGGQGMNLGIRDAIGLGPVLATHIASTCVSLPDNDQQLAEFILTRRERALSTIRLTKRIMTIAGVLGSGRILHLSYWLLWLLGKIPFIRRRIVWSLSGLGNR